MFFIVVLSFRPRASCILNTYLITLSCTPNQCSTSKQKFQMTSQQTRRSHSGIFPAPGNIMTCTLKSSSIHDLVFPYCLEQLFKQKISFQFWLYACLSVWVYAHECTCPWRPEEGTRCCSSSYRHQQATQSVLATKPGTSAKAVYAFF